MKERPILFSSPMVRAILDGSKTQTRRVLNRNKLYNGFAFDDPRIARACPYGQPGDQLWVRETWRVGAWDSSDQLIAVDYRADGCTQREWLHVPDYDQFEGLWIASTDQALAAGLTADASGGFQWKPGEAPTVWRPSIFMPRWACRILLEVVSVRVERLQDITPNDCMHEGITAPLLIDYTTMREGFAQLWDTINGKRGYTWASSPWVWVVEFKRLGASNV